METKPCLFCDKPLECAVNDWSSDQPYGGGNVRFFFHYGSCKFDHRLDGTIYSALICDECAEKYVDKMDELTKNEI